jgi:tetratricopeptide (TPR) repeat protein
MAISEYESALALDVDNDLANDKIQEAKDAKAAHEAELAANEEAAQKEQEFNDLIAKGDAAADAKNWDEAKGYYNQANEVNSESEIPQQKIDRVNELMEEETIADQQAQLQKYLAKGKEITEAGEYDKAIGLYTKAKGLFPGEAVLDEELAKVKKLKEDQEEFDQLISAGDGKLGSENFDGAIADYQEALNLGVDDPKANEKIEAAKAAKLAKENADSAAEELAAELAAKQAEYNALMAKAKDEKNAEQYQEAIATYKQAQTVLPEETEPQKRIDEINDILNNLADANALLEKYQEAIAKADAKRDEAIGAKDKDLATAAKALYSAANKIKGDESYPQEQVNNLTNLMTQWEDEDSQKQYQKIIDKADELFAAKNLDGAEELYNRAIDLGLNPGDPYPPAQIEKIKLARANAGKLDAYNELVQEGNSLFQQEKYKKAIESYEGALDLKPGAKYPTDKIAEIKKLISDMAQAEKEKNELENAIEIDPGYLGEEVSMSEEEIAQMWAGLRDDEVTSVDEKYDSYKEKVGAEEKDEINYQTGRTESINEGYEQMDQDIMDTHEAWDQQRKDVLPEMEDFKEREKDKMADLYDVEKSRSNDLNDYYEVTEQERSEYEISLDEGRKDNIDDMEDYKFDRSEINLDLAEAEREVTYDNNTYYDAYELERDEENLAKDERRKDNIVDMVDYKEDQIDFNMDLIDQGVSTTYETHGDYREMAEEFEQFAEDGDVRRKEETVVQMEAYVETKSEVELKNKNRSIEVTDEVNEYNEEYHDYLEEFADDMDIPREENISEMEVYFDERSDDFQDDLATNEERSQENYHDKDDVKQAQFDMKDEESLMVESNMTDMESYKDFRSDENAGLKTEFDDAGYENSVSMDSVKAQKATMFSDDIVDPLANSYPEGITEKTYQRTNNLGEVIEITIVRIVVRGNKADEYKKVTSKWNTAYFKNGGVINEYIWDTETN